MISERFNGENTSATARLVLSQRALNFQRMATDEFGRERITYHQRDGLLPCSQIERITTNRGSLPFGAFARNCHGPATASVGSHAILGKPRFVTDYSAWRRTAQQCKAVPIEGVRVF